MIKKQSRKEKGSNKYSENNTLFLSKTLGGH